MYNLPQKLEKNMQNYNKKMTNFEQMSQPRKKYYSKSIRERKHYSGLEQEAESDESNSYVEG